MSSSHLSNSRLQSFLYGEMIHQASDDHGPVQVFDDGDERYLMFGSIYEQSCHRKSNPAYLVHDYTRAMLLTLLFQLPRHVTLLGLGGGSLASCLHRHYPRLELHAVELRAPVIDIAQRYFQLPTDSRLRITQMDAGEYLAQAPAGVSDLILCDLFNADGVDNQQLQPELFRQCHRLLQPEGWLVLNYFHGHRIHTGTWNALIKQFGSVYTCSLTSGNWVVLASKTPQIRNHRLLRQHARHLECRLGFPMQEYVEKLEPLECFS